MLRQMIASTVMKMQISPKSQWQPSADHLKDAPTETQARLMPSRKTGEDRPGQPVIFILTGRGDADARFVSGAITDYAVVVRRGYAIEREFQSLNRLLKRVGASSV
jgi:hypothetical protein